MLLRLLLVAAFAAAVVVAGRAWRARDGRMTATADRLGATELARLGVTDAVRTGVVGVLLTSATCSTCEAAKGVLDDVARERRRFAWCSADVADHLDLVRALGVLRAPTLLVVAPDGRIVARTSGVPRADELRRTIDATVPHTARRRAPLRASSRPGERAAGVARRAAT
ncbi:MAG: hypothetical protein RLZZ272_518 [Actinomycetota bacterium]|jgi:thioredoxin-like negative regulator of GroEL